MFLEYIDFIFKPFRNVWNKYLTAKNVKGNFQVEVGQMKNLGTQAKGKLADGRQKLGGQPGAPGAPQQGYPPGAPQQFGQQQGGYPPPQQYGYQQGGPQMQPPGMPGAPGMPPGAPPGFPPPPGGFPPGFPPPGMPPMGGAPGPGAPNPSPPIRTQGFWIFKKRFCSQCQQQLDKTWDACPYCAQMAAQAAAAPAKLQKMKTMAIQLDQTGGSAGTMQLLGWLVPLAGPQRGELFTLQPKNVIGNGNDPTVNIILNDKFMSSKHAEIVAEQGLWILKDAGSTNGTYVNNKRVDRHELVDNDFIKFGNAMLKFKSL